MPKYYFPVDLVDAVLEKHGGIVGADFTNDCSRKWEALYPNA